MSKEEPLICINCVKDKRLKMLIEQIGKSDKCDGCEENAIVINSVSNEFSQFIKALVRFHYSEWDYNTHFGGDHYYQLFDSSGNIFFDKNRFKDSDVFDELVSFIDDAECYEDPEKGVSIFAGYWKGDQNPPLTSIKSDRDTKVMEISARLKNENFFLFEDEMLSILKSYSTNCALTLKKESTYFRGRIGYDDKKRSIDGGWEGEIVYVPFSNSKIGAPPPFLTNVGRINRHGVSFFYCATDKYTAISEIRPHPGDKVSIGQFILKNDINVFDLSDKQFLNYYETDKKLDEFKTLSTLCELMNKVVPPSERDFYSITQLIADCARILNFDGILFNSSVGEGSNLVIFDPAQVEYTFENAEVVEVDDVKYNYSSREWAKKISDIE